MYELNCIYTQLEENCGHRGPKIPHSTFFSPQSNIFHIFYPQYSIFQILCQFQLNCICSNEKRILDFCYYVTNILGVCSHIALILDGLPLHHNHVRGASQSCWGCTTVMLGVHHSHVGGAPQSCWGCNTIMLGVYHLNFGASHYER